MHFMPNYRIHLVLGEMARANGLVLISIPVLFYLIVELLLISLLTLPVFHVFTRRRAALGQFMELGQRRRLVWRSLVAVRLLWSPPAGLSLHPLEVVVVLRVACGRVWQVRLLDSE